MLLACLLREQMLGPSFGERSNCEHDDANCNCCGGRNLARTHSDCPVLEPEPATPEGRATGADARGVRGGVRADSTGARLRRGGGEGAPAAQGTRGEAGDATLGGEPTGLRG